MGQPTPGDIERLPLDVRLLRCHDLAEYAFNKAADAATEQDRNEYMSLGKNWRRLAVETEAALKRMRGHS